MATVADDLIDLSDVAAKLKNAGIPQSLWDQASSGRTSSLDPMDAGDVRDGRQQEGAAVPAEGRRTSTT